MKKLLGIIIGLTVLINGLVMAESGENSSYQDGYNAGYNAGYNDGSDNVYIPTVPNVVFIAQEKLPEVKAGESFVLSINYKNDSEYTAKNVKITPVFDNTPLVYERPIIFETTNNFIRGREATATFPFKVKENAKKGVYAINFKIEYKNTSKENYSKTATAYFKIIDEKLASVVTISNILTEPESIVAGQNFVLKFNVNNLGDLPMNDTSLRLTELSTDKFMPVDGNDYAYIGKINGHSSVTKTFNMIASKDIPKGDNTVGLAIKYLNEENEAITEQKNIYIHNVINDSKKEEDKDETTTLSKPKIIIESYSTMPTDIVAGDSFVFNFKIKNTSRSTPINNMKITISSAEGAFMIANGSNTFYVEKMAATSNITNSIRLNVKQDLTSKSYPIQIAFDYEDDNGNAYQSSEIINIPVTEYSKLVINSASAGEGMINNQTSLSFDYINMGKATISNLTASVEGDYEAVQEINYIGNLEPGNSDYYDIPVKPTKEGENFGILTLSFEDTSGKKIEVKKEFSGFAMAEPVYEDNGGMDFVDPGMNEIEEDSRPVWQYIAWGIGSFLVCFILAKIITTKIVRKKLEEDI